MIKVGMADKALTAPSTLTVKTGNLAVSSLYRNHR